MKIYTFNVSEHGMGTVSVKARNTEEAEEIAQEAINNGEFKAIDEGYEYEILGLESVDDDTEDLEDDDA